MTMTMRMFLLHDRPSATEKNASRAVGRLSSAAARHNAGRAWDARRLRTAALPRVLIALALVSLSAGIMADEYSTKYAAGLKALADGEADKALETFRALEVEYPDAAPVQLGAGCALYKQAEQKLAGGTQADAEPLFQEAKGTFDRVPPNAPESMRMEAAFNAATCVGALAKAAVGADPAKLAPEQYQAAVSALRGAVTAYENVLRQFPVCASARKNLDNMNYLLKLALQNPPGNMPAPTTVIQNVGTDVEDAQVHVEGEDTVVFVAPKAAVERI